MTTIPHTPTLLDAIEAVTRHRDATKVFFSRGILNGSTAADELKRRLDCLNLAVDALRDLNLIQLHRNPPQTNEP